MTNERIHTFFSLSRYSKSLLFAMLFILLTGYGYSQSIEASASVDTNVIQIGKQFQLKLEAKAPSNTPLEWPVLADTFSNLEVVNKFPIDTITSNGSDLHLSQKIIITGFDSGYHVIPPIRFGIKGSSDSSLFAETDPVLITVNTMAVDTSKFIRDIKGQIVIPYSWQDFLPYIFGIIILILAAVLLIRYLKNRKVTHNPVERVIPQRPAHEIALEQLKILEEAKLWQQGNFKEYYTRLSDIIRTFIEHRWLLNAMEMTTDEILQLKPVSSQEQEVFNQLKNLLVTADQVKFAKMIPVVTDNELCFDYAYNFVKSNVAVTERKEDEKV